MKLYYISTVLLVLCSLTMAVKVDSENMDLDLLGVRVLLNKGRPSVDGSFCSYEDEQLLQASLNQVLPWTRRRNLRAGEPQQQQQHGRELVNCRNVCRGFPVGSCYIVYPSCVGYRRELSQSVSNEKEEKEETESDTDEKIPRVLQRRSTEQMEAIEKKCSRMIKGVEDKLMAIIQEVEEGLSSPCLTLVRKKMTVDCELMNE